MSISVFSKHLFERRAAIESAAQRKMVPARYDGSILEELRLLEKTNDLPDVLANYDYQNKIAEEANYIVCTCPEVRRITKWITTNIIHTMPKDSYQTRWVKIRIATDMINKYVYNNRIPKYIGIYFHDNFVKNVLELAQDLENESLPFLGPIGRVVRLHRAHKQLITVIGVTP